MVRWYLEKHPAACPSEIGFINSIPIERCPRCGCPSIRKYGKRGDGIQTCQCLDGGCGRRLNPLTNTVFDSRKIPLTEWAEYLIHLFEYHSVSSAASDNRNADSTGFYWLEKVFIVLRHYQDPIVLGDVVYIDETYVAEELSALALAPGGKRLRGLSRNQRCIYCATDGRSATLTVGGFGKPSKKSSLAAYSPHVQASPTSSTTARAPTRRWWLRPAPPRPWSPRG